jgi:hypothetical protein
MFNFNFILPLLRVSVCQGYVPQELVALRTAKSGSNVGSQFWGAPVFHAAEPPSRFMQGGCIVPSELQSSCIFPSPMKDSIKQF